MAVTILTSLHSPPSYYKERPHRFESNVDNRGQEREIVWWYADDRILIRADARVPLLNILTSVKVI